MTESQREGFHRIVRSVASPLRFFAVAAASLAAIIVVLAWKSNLPPEITNNLIVIAFGALIALIFILLFANNMIKAHGLTVTEQTSNDSE